MRRELLLCGHGNAVLGDPGIDVALPVTYDFARYPNEVQPARVAPQPQCSLIGAEIRGRLRVVHQFRRFGMIIFMFHRGATLAHAVPRCNLLLGGLE
jgi:hypothetical protein